MTERKRAARVLRSRRAIVLESAFLHPTANALMGTSVWQTNHNQYSYAGKRMIGQFVAHLLSILTIGIWFGVLIDARRAA